MRAGTIEALEYFEANLRQVVAYTVSKNISCDQNIYINRRNYSHGRETVKSKLSNLLCK